MPAQYKSVAVDHQRTDEDNGPWFPGFRLAQPDRADTVPALENPYYFPAQKSSTVPSPPPQHSFLGPAH